MKKREDVYGELFDRCRQLPCILAEHKEHKCYGHITGHHVKSVGSGGRDKKNLVPVCVQLHALLHGQVYGITAKDICERFEIDLADIAKSTYEQLVSVERIDDLCE